MAAALFFNWIWRLVYYRCRKEQTRTPAVPSPVTEKSSPLAFPCDLGRGIQVLSYRVVLTGNFLESYAVLELSSGLVPKVVLQVYAHQLRGGRILTQELILPDGNKIHTLVWNNWEREDLLSHIQDLTGYRAGGVSLTFRGFSDMSHTNAFLPVSELLREGGQITIVCLLRSGTKASSIPSKGEDGSYEPPEEVLKKMVKANQKLTKQNTKQKETMKNMEKEIQKLQNQIKERDRKIVEQIRANKERPDELDGEVMDIEPTTSVDNSNGEDKKSQIYAICIELMSKFNKEKEEFDERRKQAEAEEIERRRDLEAWKTNLKETIEDDLQNLTTAVTTTMEEQFSKMQERLDSRGQPPPPYRIFNKSHAEIDRLRGIAERNKTQANVYSWVASIGKKGLTCLGNQLKSQGYTPPEICFWDDSVKLILTPDQWITPIATYFTTNHIKFPSATTLSKYTISNSNPNPFAAPTPQANPQISQPTPALTTTDVLNLIKQQQQIQNNQLQARQQLMSPNPYGDPYSNPEISRKATVAVEQFLLGKPPNDFHLTLAHLRRVVAPASSGPYDPKSRRDFLAILNGMVSYMNRLHYQQNKKIPNFEIKMKAVEVAHSRAADLTDGEQVTTASKCWFEELIGLSNFCGAGFLATCTLARSTGSGRRYSSKGYTNKTQSLQCYSCRTRGHINFKCPYKNGLEVEPEKICTSYNNGTCPLSWKDCSLAHICSRCRKAGQPFHPLKDCASTRA